MSAVKRIINKDIKAINNLNLNEQGIFIEFNENNMYEAYAMIIAPEDSLYFGGVLYFTINFPKNYPFSPPSLKYMSSCKTRIHPNLYVNGKVCLSILGTWSGPKWTTVMDITTVLLSIQSLLDNNPLHHEPGQEKNVGLMNDLYNKAITYESINSLLIKNYKTPPENFKVFNLIIKNHIKDKNENILKKINENKDIKGSICVSFYRINLYLDYESLKKNYENLLEIE